MNLINPDVINRIQSCSGGESITLSLNDDRWLTIDKLEHDGYIISLFSNCRWNLYEAAERGLRRINLRESPSPALALGTYQNALIVSLRLQSHRLDSFIAETSIMTLIRFSDSCIGAS